MSSQDYPWIRAWGKFMCSRDWYIQQEVTRAREDNAPENAIYEKSDPGTLGRTHSWATTDDITSIPTRHALGLPELDKKEGVEE